MVRTGRRHLTKTQVVRSGGDRHGFSPARSPASLRVMCSEFKCFTDRQRCKKHHPCQLRGVCPRHTGGRERASATSMQTPAPPHTSAPHFHRFKGQHCSIHQRGGGLLPTPSTSLPAQSHPTNVCTWQTRGCTPLTIAGRFTGALCVPMFPNMWQMCWYNAITW